MIILNDILEKLKVEVAMDDNLGILFPVPRKSVVNSIVAALPSMAV